MAHALVSSCASSRCCGEKEWDARASKARSRAGRGCRSRSTGEQEVVRQRGLGATTRRLERGGTHCDGEVHGEPDGEVAQVVSVGALLLEEGAHSVRLDVLTAHEPGVGAAVPGGRLLGCRLVEVEVERGEGLCRLEVVLSRGALEVRVLGRDALVVRRSLMRRWCGHGGQCSRWQELLALGVDDDERVAGERRAERSGAMKSTRPVVRAAATTPREERALQPLLVQPKREPHTRPKRPRGAGEQEPLVSCRAAEMPSPRRQLHQLARPLLDTATASPGQLDDSMAVPPYASSSQPSTESTPPHAAAASPTSSSPADSALFPPLHTRDVLACQFSAWYPLFKRHSPKATVLRPIPHEADFLDYLESDGLFLPEGSGPMGCVPPLAHSTRRTRAHVITTRPQPQRAQRLGRRRRRRRPSRRPVRLLAGQRRRRRACAAVHLPAPRRRDSRRPRAIRRRSLSQAQLVVAAGASLSPSPLLPLARDEC